MSGGNCDSGCCEMGMFVLKGLASDPRYQGFSSGLTKRRRRLGTPELPGAAREQPRPRAGLALARSASSSQLVVSSTRAAEDRAAPACHGGCGALWSAASSAGLWAQDACRSSSPSSSEARWRLEGDVARAADDIGGVGTAGAVVVWP